MEFYLFNGKNLTKLEKSFNGRGIFGLFSVDEHPADPNVFVFYEGGNKYRGFHHPTKRDFECENWGFQGFLKEQFLLKKWGSFRGINGRI